MDEAQILIGLKQNNKYAHDLLFDLLYDQVRFLSGELVKDDYEADDIAIHALAKFWAKEAPQFDSYSEVRKYIFTVARDAAIDFLRGMARPHISPNKVNHVTARNHDNRTEPTILTVEMFEILFDAIDELPEDCRDIFKLVYFEKCPRPMVAAGLKISESAVEWHINNARNALRERLEGKGFVALLLTIELCYN